MRSYDLLLKNENDLWLNQNFKMRFLLLMVNQNNRSTILWNVILMRFAMCQSDFNLSMHLSFTRFAYYIWENLIDMYLNMHFIDHPSGNDGRIGRHCLT